MFPFIFLNPVVIFLNTGVPSVLLHLAAATDAFVKSYVGVQSIERTSSSCLMPAPLISPMGIQVASNLSLLPLPVAAVDSLVYPSFRTWVSVSEGQVSEVERLEQRIYVFVVLIERPRLPLTRPFQLTFLLATSRSACFPLALPASCTFRFFKFLHGKVGLCFLLNFSPMAPPTQLQPPCRQRVDGVLPCFPGPQGVDPQGILCLADHSVDLVQPLYRPVGYFTHRS